MEPRYLVRIDSENFFTVLRAGEVYGSPYPSYGAAMPYRVAFEVCRRIREAGYSEAVVANEVGRPVTAADVQNASAVSEAAVMEFYDDKPLATDWELMAAVSSGEAPGAIAARLGITVADLAARMSAANSRFSSVATYLNKMNTDQRALTDQRNADLAAKRAK
jgi:hypothetical protein